MKVEALTSDETAQIADVIQYVVWAVANRPSEFLQAVYGKTTHDSYIDEKIGKANNNFTSWWCEISDGIRASAIKTAIEYYHKG